MKKDAVVAVIGGGATGTGILRDLALRGIPCVLVEQNDLASGTSGRFHGLLHSGARYAVNDPTSAKECIQENRILKEIAPHCIEDTGGVFIALRDDDPSYIDKWLEGCREAGIPTRDMSPADLLSEVPLLNRDIRKVFAVPDAAIDGFMLAYSNVCAARSRGARARTYTRVEGFRIEDRKITGIHLRDLFSGSAEIADCSFVINAAGPWAGEISDLAGDRIPLLPDMGILLAFHHRFTGRVLNRLRAPGDGDIFVPHGTVTIFGTTSKTIGNADGAEIHREEVQELLRMGSELIPEVERMRIIRAFAGVRPLIQAAGTGREATREFSLIDHQSMAGPANMLSVIGGKLTTYRHMAQTAVDLVAARLGIDTPCTTHKEQLPSPLPERAATLEDMVCECEMVNKKMLLEAAGDRDNFRLSDLRRLTRLGMGPCQGTYCTFRAACYLHERKNISNPVAMLTEDIQERWKGIRPILWGWQARQSEIGRKVYLGLLNMERLQQ